jgi:diacylglycerol kinase family enzyme
VPIQKGQAWGAPGALSGDGVVVHSDAEARQVVEQARRANRPVPVLGLLGGDLWRTLGGSHFGGSSEERLRSPDAMTFPVDIGAALVDGRLHWFVAHLVGHSRAWGRAVVAMNAQWYGSWVLGPRAHPDDGLLDVYEAELGLVDVFKVRSRVGHGAHLPHPGIRERRAPAVQITLDRALPVWLDGVSIGSTRQLSLRVEPDALRVVV